MVNGLIAQLVTQVTISPWILPTLTILASQS